MKRIYLSGPMTGLPDLNFPAFATMTDSLRAGGHTVTNPAELNPDGGTWNDCMRRDIVALMDCDTVATLPGWENSKGCSPGSPDRRMPRHDGCECPRSGNEERGWLTLVARFGIRSTHERGPCFKGIEVFSDGIVPILS